MFELSWNNNINNDKKELYLLFYFIKVVINVIKVYVVNRIIKYVFLG